MDDLGVGRALRRVRLRRRLRQSDVAARAGISQATYSELERGHLDGTTLRTLRRVAEVLEIRMSIDLRWNGGDLARLLSARHTAMAEATTTRLLAGGWDVRPEVSFSVFGERGVVDLVARHRATGAIALVELKTELLDIGDLLATTDRRRRLAPEIVRTAGWSAGAIGSVVLVAESRSNRRRVSDSARLLRAAFPSDGRHLRRWWREPDHEIRALAFLPFIAGGDASRSFGPEKRVRVRRRPAR